GLRTGRLPCRSGTRGSARRDRPRPCPSRPFKRGERRERATRSRVRSRRAGGRSVRRTARSVRGDASSEWCQSRQRLVVNGRLSVVWLPIRFRYLPVLRRQSKQKEYPREEFSPQ